MPGSVKHPQAVPLNDVQIEKGFWADRQATNRDRTIPAIYHQMKTTGRIDAWRLDWKPGQTVPHIFWDSDNAKWIEAVAYSLVNHPNPEFEQQVDEAIDLIEKAQQPDGYLNIYYTAVEPDKRWTNLRDRHELYDAGHLMEAAVAYYQATGKRKLLDVLIRYTNHIDQMFGPGEGQKRGYPGHPEAELGLMRLYHETGDKRYLNLSKFFVDERGQSPHYFDLEARARGEDPKNYWAQTYNYCQAEIPIREQAAATGHSVRASYLYSGVVDVAMETDDDELMQAAHAVWNDLIEHQMYITGGLGQAHANEGFTFSYDLPNESAYAETCAAIALVFQAQRMFHADPNSRYIDVMERALYNGMISGVSYEGTHFFYANPIASFPKVNPNGRWSGILVDEYYRRSEWFDCACCPPNLARLVASVGSYMYSVAGDTVYAHLYNQNRARFQLGGAEVQIEQATDYPWDGSIHLSVQPSQPAEFDLALRIPGWCRDFRVEVNATPVLVDPVNGYVHIERQWASGDEVLLMLQMPVERIAPNPQIRQDAGQIALQRGPVVYCLEEVDNGPRLANIALPRGSHLTASVDPELFGGVGVITGDAVRIEPAAWPGGLYQPQSTVEYAHTPLKIKAIPYAFWANRDPGEMRVWLRDI